METTVLAGRNFQRTNILRRKEKSHRRSVLAEGSCFPLVFVVDLLFPVQHNVLSLPWRFRERVCLSPMVHNILVSPLIVILVQWTHSIVDSLFCFFSSFPLLSPSLIYSNKKYSSFLISMANQCRESSWLFSSNVNKSLYFQQIHRDMILICSQAVLRVCVN